MTNFGRPIDAGFCDNCSIKRASIGQTWEIIWTCAKIVAVWTINGFKNTLTYLPGNNSYLNHRFWISIQTVEIFEDIAASSNHPHAKTILTKATGHPGNFLSLAPRNLEYPALNRANLLASPASSNPNVCDRIWWKPAAQCVLVQFFEWCSALIGPSLLYGKCWEWPLIVQRQRTPSKCLPRSTCLESNNSERKVLHPNRTF